MKSNKINYQKKNYKYFLRIKACINLIFYKFYLIDYLIILNNQ